MGATSTFIWYSWDNDYHKTWVRGLAERLRADGVEANLDQWAAVPGDQLPAFMERAIADKSFVLIVCTPRYKTKSEAREGGAGYEGDIITAELLKSRNRRKFIPVLRSLRLLAAAIDRQQTLVRQCVRASYRMISGDPRVRVDMA